MANGSILTSAAILLVINMLCVFFSPELGVSNIGDVVLNAVFDEDTIETTNPNINPELDQGLQKELQGDAETSNILGLVDGLKKVFGFIITLLTLGFAMSNMLIQTGAPIMLIWLIGLPTALGFYVSIVSAIRGYNI